MVTLGSTMKSMITKAHNQKRNLIASGKVNKHPGACRMATMQWDNELATVASYNVRQCKMEHDKCRNTLKFKYSGQNLYWGSFTGTLNKAKMAQKAINSWYAEVKDSKMAYILSYPSNYKGP